MFDPLASALFSSFELMMPLTASLKAAISSGNRFSTLLNK